MGRKNKGRRDGRRHMGGVMTKRITPDYRTDEHGKTRTLTARKL
jgi:hypothetical protein